MTRVLTVIFWVEQIDSGLHFEIKMKVKLNGGEGGYDELSAENDK